MPGHWEGDLIIGKSNQSAIGTLVERDHRLHDARAPARRVQRRAGPRRAGREDQDPARVAAAIADLGPGHRDARLEHVTIDAGIDIYFCDPHSPWQRGTNENTNGLLRQYFPKGTDLSIHSAADLDWVAQELNDRPRKRLAFRKPIELIEDLLLQ